jgi:hypothetical protein
MSLANVLSTQRSVIVEEWFQTSIKLFPSEKSRFIQTSKDQFANPVGFRLRSGLAQLFDELSSEVAASPERLRPLLDKVVRVQAVQGFPAKNVAGGLLALKRIVRDRLAGEKSSKQDTSPVDALRLAAFDARIDLLAEEGLHIHQACRTKLDELKGNERRRRTYMQRRMGLDTPSKDAPVAKGGNGS